MSDFTAADYEKLGKFYLGKEYDLKSQEMEEDLVLYNSKDLVTHGVVLGMTGSGKTGLCMSLLEEAAMDNVPAIVIDPKGDIANLMLTFPEFQGSDFRPWINESDARKKEKTPDQFAEDTAKMWEKGIGSWGQTSDRVRSFRDKVDINVFTPGSKAGIPVSILASLEAPSFEVLDDGELFADCIESTVSSLLSLIGVDADPIQSPEAILLSSLFQHYWSQEQNLSLESLIRAIQSPPIDKIGVIDLDSFINSKNRQKLALKFNGLLASPGFSTWMEGPSLDINSMLYTEEGKPRISIFSIAHLSDSERMFFVSLLLNQMLGWMRTQSGTTSLRAMLYMDEIFGYLPPIGNPPSKKPLMTILKQGRAFGLGALLATQNPVDLDYKALSNIGTWWLGRLQTEKDKEKVIEGLEGAQASGDGSFNKKEIEQLLAGLGSRVFLMRNVHDDVQTIFHVRWVMSYLRGPLTRSQIKVLMDPKREQFEGRKIEEKTSTPASNPFAQASAQPKQEEKVSRPLVGEGIKEFFAPIIGELNGVTYYPHLIRDAKVHFTSRKANTEGSKSIRFANRVDERGVAWDDNTQCDLELRAFRKNPDDKVGFAELPGFAMNADNYKPIESEFEDWLYRNERSELFFAKLLDEYSTFGESEREFRARLQQAGREKRDEAIEALTEKYEKKIEAKEVQMKRAEITVEKEKAEAQSATLQAGVSVVGSLLGGLLGGRRSTRGAISGATRAMKQRKDIQLAEEKVEIIAQQIEEIETELRQEVEELKEKLNPESIELEEISLKPYKKDIDIQEVALLWLPFDSRMNGVWS